MSQKAKYKAKYFNNLYSIIPTEIFWNEEKYIFFGSMKCKGKKGLKIGEGIIRVNT